HLRAVDDPACAAFASLGLDAVQLEATVRLAVRQQRDRAAVGNAREQGLALRGEGHRVAALDQPRGQHRAADEGLQRDAPTQFLGYQGGLDEAATEAAERLGDRQR